jgi:hypothetical protein
MFHSSDFPFNTMIWMCFSLHKNITRPISISQYKMSSLCNTWSRRNIEYLPLTLDLPHNHPRLSLLETEKETSQWKNRLKFLRISLIFHSNWCLICSRVQAFPLAPEDKNAESWCAWLWKLLTFTMNVSSWCLDENCLHMWAFYWWYIHIYRSQGFFQSN